MKLFKSAFCAWLDTHPSISLRSLSQSSGVDSSMLSLIKKGTRQITFDALTKLLPAIESASTRAEAVTLHLAYLADETVDAYRTDINIRPIGSDGNHTLDTYAQLAADWEGRARNDSTFYNMWVGMHNYMYHPELLTRQDPSANEGIALLAEPITSYEVSPRTGGSHPQDIDRLDPMPSQHAAQEHQQD